MRAPYGLEMRSAAIVLGYVAGVFVGGALVSPWVYWIGRHLMDWSSVGGSAPPFHRFVSRCILGLAIAGIWVLSRTVGMSSWRSVGFRRDAQWKGRWARGFLLGWLMLAALAATEIIMGGRGWRANLSVPGWGRLLLSAGMAAVMVSVLEELVFRGVLFGFLRREAGFWTALILSSAIYAWVHFFERPPSPMTVDWLSGFGTLGGMMRGFVEWQQLVPGFFNLFLAGCILAVSYERSGSLYFSMGLHAGWIFWLKLYSSGAVVLEGWFWGSSRLIDGWAAVPLLVVALVFVSKRVGRERDLGNPEDSRNEGLGTNNEMEKLA